MFRVAAVIFTWVYAYESFKSARSFIQNKQQPHVHRLTFNQVVG